jgi:hypothetical protein
LLMAASAEANWPASMAAMMRSAESPLRPVPVASAAPANAVTNSAAMPAARQRCTRLRVAHQWHAVNK